MPAINFTKLSTDSLRIHP